MRLMTLIMATGLCSSGTPWVSCYLCGSSLTHTTSKMFNKTKPLTSTAIPNGIHGFRSEFEASALVIVMLCRLILCSFGGVKAHLVLWVEQCQHIVPVPWGVHWGTVKRHHWAQMQACHQKVTVLAGRTTLQRKSEQACPFHNFYKSSVSVHRVQSLFIFRKGDE